MTSSHLLTMALWPKFCNFVQKLQAIFAILISENLIYNNTLVVPVSIEEMTFLGTINDYQIHYVTQGAIFMEQNMRFELILGQLATLKKNWGPIMSNF